MIGIIVIRAQNCYNNSTGKSYHTEIISLAFEKGSGEEGNLFSASIEYIADIVAANVPVCQEERQEG